MIPTAKIFVHFVDGTDLLYAEETINFEKTFQNSISIEAPVEAKPGADIELKVKTDPNSYVDLLGVDQSVLLLKCGNDFDKNKIFNGLSSFDSSSPMSLGLGPYPGRNTGVVTMTNANFDFKSVIAFVEPKTGLIDDNLNIQQPIVRKEFPETWIFLNQEGIHIITQRQYQKHGNELGLALQDLYEGRVCPGSSMPAVNEMWTRLKDTVISTANSILGSSRRDRKNWFNDECKLATERKNVAYRVLAQLANKK